MLRNLPFRDVVAAYTYTTPGRYTVISTVYVCGLKQEIMDYAVLTLGVASLLYRARQGTTRKRHRKQKHLVLAPTTVDLTFEVSIHTLPRLVASEVHAVVPSVETPSSSLLAILTAQKSKYELVEWGDDVAKEKDDLLERFVAWASTIREELTSRGYWADYIDPCSGLPANTDGNKIYGEVDGFQALLGYRTQNANCCKILLHPRWGSAVYPASMFTNAPSEIVVQVVNNSKKK